MVTPKDATPLKLSVRKGLYAAARYLGLEEQRALDLRIPIPVYFKDPLVAKTNPALDIDKDFRVPWEPGITHGPTSARFAVVDFDGTTNHMEPPARWDEKRSVFLGLDDQPLDEAARGTAQFRQVSTWATLQHTLDYFEGGAGLGRRILWGFEGNRLIVVPQAGYGENAFYDRNSKSLQFYYFGPDDERVYTCLSSDIVNHEFGHAVLDGIRPYYFEAVSPETAAFHEFVGDLTAILMAFGNASFRKALIAETDGDLAGDTLLSGIAPEFGNAVDDQPYLRSARNKHTMAELRGDLRPHTLSEVLTGAMFDILIAVSKQYRARTRQDGKPLSAAQAFAYSVQRMQTMAIQPLDLLPPVEVTFRDYALAVLRAEEVANPTDPRGYRATMFDVFVKRGILDETDREPLLGPHAVFKRLDIGVFHDTDRIASSRAEAYRFLNDNRQELFIPADADIVVSDVFLAEKQTIDRRRLPRQVLVQYLWREDLLLEGERFGQFAGRTTSLLCGATLALDQNGNVLAWARKPGFKASGAGKKAKAEQEAGVRRRDEYLDALARRIEAGMIGEGLGSARGLLAKSFPPLVSRDVEGSVRFELTPHLAIHEDEDEMLGGARWQISS